MIQDRAISVNRNPEMPQTSSWKPAACLRWGALAVLLAAPWFADIGDAAVSIYLKFDNASGITGESLSNAHKNEIEILSFSFGAANSGTTHTGGGAGAGKSSVQDITLYKYIDKSSLKLLLKAMTGGPINSAEIKFVETINDKEIPIVAFTLTNNIVTSVLTGGSDGQDRLTDSFSLNFSGFTYQTFSYGQDGQQTTNPSMNWDIAQNTGGTGGTTPNTAPTLSSIGTQTTSEDSTVTASFTIDDGQTVAGSLTLARSSDNAILLPLSGITFGGSGANRIVTLTPAANQSGTATVGITVTDAGGLTVTKTFSLNVSAVNDAPFIQTLGNQITSQDTPLGIILNVIDVDTAAANVQLSATSGNPALIPVSNIAFSGNGASTQMTLTPVAGEFGSALITLTANDGSLNSSPVAFTLTVNPAGGPGPTDIQFIGPGGISPQVQENSVTDILVGSLTATDPDSGSNITYTLTDSAGGRFKIAGPAQSQIFVDNGGLLDFETDASHTITVRATDSELHTLDEVFTIAVTNLNEAPLIGTSVGSPFPFNSTTSVSGIALSDPDSGPEDVTATFQIAVGTLHLDDSGGLATKVTGNDSTALSVTAPIADINAVLAAGGLTFTSTGVTPATYPLAISVNDLGHRGDNSTPLTTNASLDIIVHASPFQQWRIIHFTPAELLDSTLSGPYGDADNDSIANLLEYGVGSDPRDPSSGPGLVESLQIDDGGVTYPAVRFPRLKPSIDSDLSTILEFATDDFNWRNFPGDSIEVSATPVEVSETSIDENREMVVIRSAHSTASYPRQMMRLRFTIIP